MKGPLAGSTPEQSPEAERGRALHCAQLILEGAYVESMPIMPPHHKLDWFRGANIAQATIMDPTLNELLGWGLELPERGEGYATTELADIISDGYFPSRSR